jgi:hypothetical protein
MTIVPTKTIAIAAIALLTMSAAGAVAAGSSAGKSKKASTYSPAVINQARKANQARSGDPEWDKCMASYGDDFIQALGDCFCLLTPDAACGADHSEPVD